MTGIIDNEVHPHLNRNELEEIREFRVALEKDRRVKKQNAMIYQWATTGKLNPRQFALLMIYHFRNLDIPAPIPE